jgi:hypothetical protein
MALATIRHPGPAHALAAVIRANPDWSWIVAAAGVGRRVLITDHVDISSRPTIRIMTPAADGSVWRQCDPSQALAAADPTVADTDLAGAERVLEGCRQLLAACNPDVVVRTTPSTGIGPDELVATAAAVPTLCIQDFYGLGSALAGRHAVANKPVAGVVTIDAWAEQMVRDHTGLPTVSAGWIAHERFLHFPSYRTTRNAARQACGLLADDRLVLIVGSSPDIPLGAERELLEAVAKIGSAAPRNQRTCFAYRSHPRRPAKSVELLKSVMDDRSMCMVQLPVVLSPAQFLAMPDIVISRASVLNIEVLAYAATEKEHVSLLPLSVYVYDDSEPLFDGYWGHQSPPTHRHAAGNLIAGPYDLVDQIIDNWNDSPSRRELDLRARTQYAPRAASPMCQLDALVQRFTSDVRVCDVQCDTHRRDDSIDSY